MSKRVTAFLCMLAVILFLPSCKKEETVSKAAYDNMYAHMTAVWADSLKPYACDIAFYGDSRVIGADWVNAYPGYSVVNLGIGGDKVEETITREPLLRALDVKVCFLAIGGNNCSRADFSAADFRERYDRLLTDLESMNITVYLNTVSGVRKTEEFNDGKLVDRMNANIQTVNGIILALGEAHGMTVIDMAALMNEADGTLKEAYASDGVHFSEAGNALWFETLRPYVETCLQ